MYIEQASTSSCKTGSNVYNYMYIYVYLQVQVQCTCMYNVMYILIIFCVLFSLLVPTPFSVPATKALHRVSGHAPPPSAPPAISSHWSHADQISVSEAANALHVSIPPSWEDVYHVSLQLMYTVYCYCQQSPNF